MIAPVLGVRLRPGGSVLAVISQRTPETLPETSEDLVMESVVVGVGAGSGVGSGSGAGAGVGVGVGVMLNGEGFRGSGSTGSITVVASEA